MAQDALTTEPAYWCSRSLLITAPMAHGPRTLTLSKPFARVGSDPVADVVLPPQSAPRRAIYLHAAEEGIFFVKLFEENSEEATGRGWFRNGESIRVGTVPLSARLSGPLPPTGPRDVDWESKGSAPGPHPVLVATADGRKLGKLLIARRLSIVGRRQPSNIRLASHSVSACHCVFYRDAGKLWVIDLLSGNGTYVNDEPVEAAELPPDSRLRIGRVVLEYQDQVETTGEDFGELTSIPLLDGPAKRSRTARSRRSKQTAAESPSLTNELGKAAETVAIDLDDQPPMAGGESQQLQAVRREREATVARFAEEQARWDTERSSWNTERQRLRTALQRLRGELQFYTEDPARQKQYLESGWAELEKLRGDLQDRQEQIETQWQIRQQELAARFRTIEHEQSRLATEREAWQAERDRWEGQRGQFAEESAGIWKRLAEEDAQLAAARETFCAQRAQEDARIAATTAEIEEARRALAEQREALAAERIVGQDEVRRAKESLEQQRRVMAAQTKHQPEQSSGPLAQDERESAWAQERRALEEWIAQLEQELAAQAAQLATVESQTRAMDQLVQERHRLTKAASDLEAERQEFQRSRAAWEADQQRLTEQWTAKFEHLREQEESLASERAGLDDERARYEKERNDWKLTLEAERQKLSQQRAELVEAREAWHEQVKQWQTQIAQQREQLLAERQQWDSRAEQWRVEQARAERDLAERRASIGRTATALATQEAQLQKRSRQQQQEHQALEAEIQRWQLRVDSEAAALSADREHWQEERQLWKEGRQLSEFRLHDVQAELARKQQDLTAREAEFERQRRALDMRKQQERECLEEQRSALAAEAQQREIQWQALEELAREQQASLTTTREAYEAERREWDQRHAAWQQEHTSQSEQWAKRFAQLEQQEASLRAERSQWEGQREVQETERARWEHELRTRERELMAILALKEEELQRQIVAWEVSRDQQQATPNALRIRLEQEAAPLAAAQAAPVQAGELAECDESVESNGARRGRRRSSPSRDTQPVKFVKRAAKEGTQAVGSEPACQGAVAAEPVHPDRLAASSDANRFGGTAPPGRSNVSDSGPEKADVGAAHPLSSPPTNANRGAEAEASEEATVPDELADRALEALLEFRRTKTRWHRLKNAWVFRSRDKP